MFEPTETLSCIENLTKPREKIALIVERPSYLNPWHVPPSPTAVLSRLFCPAPSRQPTYHHHAICRLSEE